MAEQLDALLKKYGPSTLPFEEWKQEANKIRFFGQTKEDIFDILGYPVEPDDTPIKVTYKGDKGGYDRRTGQRTAQAQKRTAPKHPMPIVPMVLISAVYRAARTSCVWKMRKSR